MSRLIPAAERTMRARPLTQKTRDLQPLLEAGRSTGYLEFSGRCRTTPAYFVVRDVSTNEIVNQPYLHGSYSCTYNEDNSHRCNG